MRFFFESSSAFHRQLTSLYDVVHPAAAAMWNLRWQVRGYVEEREVATNDELHGRFVSGSGIGSANLRRHCLDTSWGDQVSELAVLSLYAGISLYEAWTASLEIGTKAQRERLQFPSRGTAGRTSAGGGDTVDALTSTTSVVVDRIYGDGLRAAARFQPGRREDLLLAYRCYKEARNSCAHAGRVANARAEVAYQQATSVGAGLGARGGSLSLPRLKEGQEVKVSLHDVQGLWAVMLTLVVTLDAQLAVSSASEDALLNRWRMNHSFKMLSSDPGRQQSQLRVLNNRAHLPEARALDELHAFLKDHRALI